MLSAPPLRRRLACLSYEGLILLGLALVTAAIVVFVLYLFGVEQEQHVLRPVMQIAEFAVLTGYGTWFWSAGRQTLPMKTWHVRIVTSTGLPLNVGRALWRAMLCWFWILPALLLAAAFRLGPASTGWLLCAGILLWACTSFLRTDRQYLHDVLAGSRLIVAAP